MNPFFTLVYSRVHHFREWRIPGTEVIEEMKEQLRRMPPDTGALERGVKVGKVALPPFDRGWVM